MNDDLFRNTLATNGLRSGYAPRRHKRKRKGLRFTVVVILLLGSGGVYYADQVDKVWNDTISYSQSILGLF